MLGLEKKSDLEKSLDEKLKLPDFLKGELDDEFSEGAERTYDHFKHLHIALKNVAVTGAEIRRNHPDRTSSLEALKLFDEALAKLNTLLGLNPKS